MRKNKSARGGRLDSVTACISTTMVLILVGTVLFFAAVADNLSRSLRENFTVEVLLNDSIDQNLAQIAALHASSGVHLEGRSHAPAR